MTQCCSICHSAARWLWEKQKNSSSASSSSYSDFPLRFPSRRMICKNNKTTARQATSQSIHSLWFIVASQSTSPIVNRICISRLLVFILSDCCIVVVNTVIRRHVNQFQRWGMSSTVEEEQILNYLHIRVCLLLLLLLSITFYHSHIMVNVSTLGRSLAAVDVRDKKRRGGGDLWNVMRVSDFSSSLNPFKKSLFSTQDARYVKKMHGQSLGRCRRLRVSFFDA